MPTAVLRLLLVGCLLAGCAPARAEADQAAGPVVVASFTVIADLVAQVGGPRVEVTSVTGTGMNVHGYEPSPDELRRMSEADLVFANGLGLETWLADLTEALEVPVVVLTEGIDPLPIHGSAAQTGGLAYNPHAWMSPTHAGVYVRRIAAALAEVDPAGAPGYLERAEAYRAELAELAAEVSARLAVVPEEHRVLVTCEGAFSYLVRDLGLREAYLWPVNAERQGTPRQVAGVIDEVRAGAIPAVFCESTISPTPALQVARETGAAYGGELYVDSLSEPDGPVPTHLDLLRYDVDLIVAALGGAS